MGKEFDGETVGRGERKYREHAQAGLKTLGAR